MIRLLFEHGVFTLEDTLAASQVQSWLALQIPFYVFVIVGVRLLAALDGYRLIVGIGAINLVLNVIADLVLMQFFGVTGIAMATSLVYLVMATATYFAIRMKLTRDVAPGLTSYALRFFSRNACRASGGPTMIEVSPGHGKHELGSFVRGLLPGGFPACGQLQARCTPPGHQKTRQTMTTLHASR